MDPFVVYLTVVIGGLGSYALYITKRYISHLEDDLLQSRKVGTRAVAKAKEATSVAEDG